MNKRLLVLAALVLVGKGASGSTSTSDACGSHYFTPRSITTDLMYIDGLGTMYDRHHREKDKWLTYTGEILFQTSKKSKQLGSAFLLGNGSNQITVGYDNSTGANVNAAWLVGTQKIVESGLTGTLGTLSISPQRTAWGYLGNWFFNLDSIWCGLWVDITSAILNVQHSLHPSETDTQALVPSCPNSNILDALNYGGITLGPVSLPQVDNGDNAYVNGTPRYSKFFGNTCDSDIRRTGIDDVQIRLGYDYKWCNDNILGLYAIGTIPGGRHPKNEYIFEPLVGSKHASLGAGFTFGYDLWCNKCGDASITLMSDFNYRYVFKHDECRTFDLTNGAMTRYLLLSANPGAATNVAAYPAANFLTQSVSVKPRSTIQWWAAANIEYCSWDVEIGYNLFWRQSEKISGVTAPCASLGIADIAPITGGHTGLTGQPAATIGSFPTTGGTWTALTASSLNVSSAEAVKVFTNKVYGGLSWDGTFCDCMGWTAGFGGAYEFVSGDNRCGALPFWSAFGKAGLSF